MTRSFTQLRAQARFRRAVGVFSDRRPALHRTFELDRVPRFSHSAEKLDQRVDVGGDGSLCRARQNPAGDVSGRDVARERG